MVHEAFEMTRCPGSSTWWLTPYTIVASTSLPPGAEMITFFAPPSRWAPAAALLVKRPVLSMTTSTPSSPHGSFAGSRSASTRMRSPLTTIAPSSTSTVPGKRPCTVS